MHLMPGLSCAGGNSGERQMIVGVRLQRAVNTPGRTAQVRYVCGNLCIWKWGRMIFLQNRLLHFRQRGSIRNSSISTVYNVEDQLLSKKCFFMNFKYSQPLGKVLCVDKKHMSQMHPTVCLCVCVLRQCYASIRSNKCGGSAEFHQQFMRNNLGEFLKIEKHWCHGFLSFHSAANIQTITGGHLFKKHSHSPPGAGGCMCMNMLRWRMHQSRGNAFVEQRWLSSYKQSTC